MAGHDRVPSALGGMTRRRVLAALGASGVGLLAVGRVLPAAGASAGAGSAEGGGPARVRPANAPEGWPLDRMPVLARNARHFVGRG